MFRAKPAFNVANMITTMLEPDRLQRGLLVIFSGLPGTGKTAIARKLARALPGMLLRLDSLEMALVRSGLVAEQWDIGPAGYYAGYALAEDNLRLGHNVVVDCVNPLKITRDAWRDAAVQAGAACLEVEVICTDAIEHRRRVENRIADIPGLKLPDWEAVRKREYEPWDREHLVLDTAKLSLAESVAVLLHGVNAI